MRCHEVLKELAAPTDPLRRAPVDVHLRSCPACAARAEGLERLDQIWRATRPADPSPDEFARLWSRVEAREHGALAFPAPARSSDRPGPGWRTWARAGSPVAVAAAAVIVIAVALAWGRFSGVSGPSSPLGPAPTLPTLVALTEPVNIDPGQTVLISVKGDSVDVVDLDLDPRSLEARLDLNVAGETIASNFDLLNTFEAMAQ